MRLALAAVLALLAAATAGCGGGSTPQPLGGGAVFVPAGVVGFLAARTDRQGWRPLARALLHHEPPRLPKDTVEVDFAVLQGGTTLVLTKPEHGDWRGTAASPPQPSLADNANYLAATRAAPKDATARAYLRGDVAADRLAAIPGQITVLSGVFNHAVRIRRNLRANEASGVLHWRWASAWRTEHGYGARFRSGGLPFAQSAYVRFLQRLLPAYPPAVVDEIPADAQRVVDVTVSPSTFSLMKQVPAQLRALFPGAGRDLAFDLDAVLGGETAVYTRPGGELTVVTSPADLTNAREKLADLVAAARPGFPKLHTAAIGGQLVISTTAAGIEAFRSAGGKLAADPAFGKADIPPRVSGLVYDRGKTAAWSLPDGTDATYTVRILRDGS